MFEIAAAGRPSMLVPSPNVTADHRPNAAYLADGGAAVVIRDADLTVDRLAEVGALLSQPEPARGHGRGRPAARRGPTPRP